MTTQDGGAGNTDRDRDLNSYIEDTGGMDIGPYNDNESTNSSDTLIAFVKEQYVGCHLSIPYPVDNSDSPSIVEQSQQGFSFSCIYLLFLISGSVVYPMPYASCLSSCSAGWRLSCCWVDP